MAGTACIAYFNNALVATKTPVKDATLGKGGELFGVHIVNPNASPAWVQFFNALTANVTVGTTTPNQSYWIPANAGYDLDMAACPLQFETGLTIAATTTSTGLTAPAVGLTVNLRVR